MQMAAETELKPRSREISRDHFPFMKDRARPIIYKSITYSEFQV